MPNYGKASADAYDRLERMLKVYHAPLVNAEVKVDLLFAFPKQNKNGDDVGHAVSHGGYAAYAKIRVIGLKDRAKGMGDAEIIIDGRRWDELSEETRDALIDHELEHLELKTKLGTVQRDDLNRPILRLVKHDHQFGWFNAVVRRHGEHSIEWQQYADFGVGKDSTVSQLWLPFAVKDKATGEAAGRSDRKARAVAG